MDEPAHPLRSTGRGHQPRRFPLDYPAQEVVLPACKGSWLPLPEEVPDLFGNGVQKGQLSFHGELEPLAKPAAFAALCDQAGHRKWVVYAKPPFGRPDQVLKYLARYVQRAAISNSRLLSLENGRVTFAWKDYADRNQNKTMTLDAVEFIRRFLLHVLPSGFVRIRYFGFLANRKRKEKLALCRGLLPARQTATEPNTKTGQQEPRRCPICKAGQLLFIEILTPQATLFSTCLRDSALHFPRFALNSTGSETSLNQRGSFC